METKQNTRKIVTTWGEWDRSQVSIPVWISKEANARNARKEDKIIVTYQPSQWGDLVDSIEWL